MRILDLGRIPRLTSTIEDLGFRNLLVGGCSFTSTDFGHVDFYFETLQKNYNNIKDPSWPEISCAGDWQTLPQEIKRECQASGLDWQHLTYLTWPIYCRDLLGMESVVDCSCSGAGNKHIHDSVIWALETHREYTPQNTLVVVMWSGIDRDDIMADADSIDNHSNNQYDYDPGVKLLCSGGILGGSNSVYNIDLIKKIKSDKSRSIENFILVTGLYHYLSSRGFRFVFTNFSTHLRQQGIDISKHLGAAQLQVLERMTSRCIALGDYAEKTIDGAHPTAEWHHRWAREVLIPLIQEVVK